MIDIFHQSDIAALLRNKKLVFMGDSNIRAPYKDFLCLLQNTQYIPEHTLKTKMEDTCLGDRLVFHGEKSNGRNYREERVADINGTSLSYFFLTQVYDDYVKDVLRRITHHSTPDILIVNSCLWDITRWGPTGVQKFKRNLKTLMKELKRLVPDCLVIWVTTPPLACDMKGGFLVKELQFLKYSLRFHILEANYYARKVVAENGFDVMDSHYHLKMQLQRRTNDGIHWYAAAVRYVTNLLLTHISLAWDVPLPNRYKSDIMEENIEAVTIGEIKFADSKVPEDSSTKVKSAVVRVNGQKNKENCNLSTPKKNKKSRSTLRPNPVTPKVRQTHHAYMSKVEKAKRQQRNRRRRGLMHSPAPRVPYNGQHDSGFFPSPSQISVSFSTVNTNSYFDRYSCNDVSSPLLPSPPYYQHTALLESPPSCLLPTAYQSVYGMSRSSSGYGLYNNSPLPMPYQFPHVRPGQRLQPLIDFTSNHMLFDTSF